MGCARSKEQEETKPKEQVFSWDREDRPDPKDYTVAEQDGTTTVRKPGTVNGQQFIIENCKNASIYIYDHSAMITVDKCENCVIFLGPVKGSVFLRNCKNLKCVIACQQFRSRDCQKIDTFLYCQTQPIIESSASMKFACFKYHYTGIEDHFNAAGLSLYNNNWSSIHDFTPVDGSDNWQMLPESTILETIVPYPEGLEFAELGITADSAKSVVPLTRGKHTQRFDDSCLIVFFSNQKDKCKEFLGQLEGKADIIQTKEVQMSSEDASRVFKEDKYSNLIKNGHVIGLELNGPTIIQLCELLLSQLSLNRGEVFLSANTEEAKHNINAFYNFIDVTMAV